MRFNVKCNFNIRFSLKENKEILNRKHIQKRNFGELDIEVTQRIIKAFQKGDDVQAINLWREASYSRLPIEDYEKFYLLALKLKDMQIMDYESQK